MSMQGCAGASCAAEDIMRFIDQKLAENAGKLDVEEALKEIRAEAENIKKSADSGWY